MVEFNPDGSLNLPEHIKSQKEDKEQRLSKGHCVLIKKEIISTTAPKKCILNIKLSEAMNDNRFVDTTYRYFCDASKVPSKITKINEKEFQIEIGTHFRRCSDCTNLINRFREFLDNNVIEEKGQCGYENNFRSQTFCEEDYFD